MGKPISRRMLLGHVHKAALAVTGAVAVGEAAQMVGHPSQSPASEVITVGAPGDYAVPSLTFIRDAQAYLVRDMLGFYAIDAVCQHLGCLVKHVGDASDRLDGGDGFICPCHDSQYNAAGAVESGPAARNLRFLEITLDAADHLVIHRSREIHPADRFVV